MTSDAYVPMPNTEHPFYEDMADGIRSMLGESYIRVPLPRRLMASFDSPPEPYDATPAIATLTVKKCAGGAPFVGDARRFKGFYTWRVAVDDLGRHVAGDSALELVESW